MANSPLLATSLVLTALAFNLNLATSSRVLGACRANGHVRLQSKTTTGYCSSKSISNCCEDRKTYLRFHCSPPVKRSTPAIMTFNSFTSHGRVGGPSANPKSKHHYFRPISRTHKVTTFDNTSQDGDRFGTLDRNRSNTTQDGDRFGTLDRNRSNTTQDGDRFGTLDRNRSNTTQDGDRSGTLDQNRFGTLDRNRPNTSQDGNRLGSLDRNRPNTTQDGDRFGSLDRNRPNTSQDGNRSGSLDRYRSITTQDGRRHNVVTSNNVPKHGNKIHQRGTGKCDNKYHGDNELVVALSTGWYNGGSRCLKNIRIKGHGKSVVAKVVDECDSINGCDSQRGFRVPCGNNVVDASPAVWKALGIPKGKIGNYKITWSDV